MVSFFRWRFGKDLNASARERDERDRRRGGKREREEWQVSQNTSKIFFAKCDAVTPTVQRRVKHG